MNRRPGKLLALGASLAASVALLVLPSSKPKAPPVPPVPVAVAWPHAQRDTVTAFQPAIFLDAHPR